MKRLSALLFAACLLLPARGADALNFTPTRVVFEGPQRTATLRIFNPRNVPERISIGWQAIRMTAEGRLKQIDDPAEVDGLEPARDYVMFAPRQAVIPPQSAQIIRLMLRAPADLPDGEYRSHMVVSQQPRELPEQQLRSDGLSVRIDSVVSTTLPVIVRRGDLKAELSVESAELVTIKGNPFLETVVRRRGGRSVYADAEVTWTGPEGEELVVNSSHGQAIYSETGRRRFRYRLRMPERDTLPPGTLHYRFWESTDSGGIIAEAEETVGIPQ
jgi:P pilus assembly chaperone PapD